MSPPWALRSDEYQGSGVANLFMLFALGRLIELGKVDKGGDSPYGQRLLTYQLAPFTVAIRDGSFTSRAVLVRAAGGERHRSSCPEREPQPVVRQQWPLQRERLRWRRLKLAFSADYILGFDGEARGPE